MRLEAFFYQTPDGKPLAPGVIYRILGFSRVDLYTLVFWRLGGKNEYATGETLYKGRNRIDSAGGQLPLYTPVKSQPTSTGLGRQTVWDRVDGRVGLYGMPAAVAAKLRDPKNTVYFEV